MSLTDELQRLAELRASGALTESEFQKAKSRLLEEDDAPYKPESNDKPDQSLGHAANRYVTFQMVMAVVCILIFLFVLAPKMCSGSSPPFFP
jgi:hypothetical protein